MTEVVIPTYVEMMPPTLQAIDGLGGSGTRDEIDEEVIRRMGLTDEQVAVEFPPEATQRGSKVIHRLAWARTYLKKIGGLDNSNRGVWTLEPSAQQYLTAPPSDAADALRQADSEVRRLAREAKRRAREVHPAESIEPLDVPPDDDQDGPDDWKAVLLDRMKSFDPSAFERLTQRLLREAGFKNVQVLGRTGDGGIDGVGVYRQSLVSFPIFFQCKRYKDTVGPSYVRDFRGAMEGRGEKGLLISTGTFTAEAKREATRDGARSVELIDGDTLCDLLKEYAVGVNTQLREVVELDDAFFAEL